VPDLVLLLESIQGTHVVGVEAKYLSGKSSTEDLAVEEHERANGQRDQLAREFGDLCDSGNYPLLGIAEDRVLSVSMIYLTMETYMPRDELKTTIVPCVPILCGNSHRTASIGCHGNGPERPGFLLRVPGSGRYSVSVELFKR
jgi:hypothetical protein